MSRRRRLVIVAAGVLAAALVVAELLARTVLGLGDPPLSVAHSSIEYLFRPNQDVMRFGNRFVVNEYGMRSEPFPQKKAAGELRVLVFGDSVVNGGNLTDHEALATTLLARRLAQDLDRTVHVGNVSAGSWGPGNWLAYAREFGFFDADVVVLVASSHDAVDNPTFAPLDPSTHPQTKPLLALIEGVTRYLPRYLPRSAAQGAPAPSEEQVGAAMRRGLSDLREFLLLARAQAPRVLLLQHPEMQEIESGRWQPGHETIAQVAAECGVTVIQLAPALAAAIQRGEQPYRDNIHVNEIGQAALADVLRQEFAPR